MGVGGDLGSSLYEQFRRESGSYQNTPGHLPISAHFRGKLLSACPPSVRWRESFHKCPLGPSFCKVQVKAGRLASKQEDCGGVGR